MTHRRDVEWVDLNDPEDKILADVLNASHARIVAARDSLDAFVGVLSVRDYLIAREKTPDSEITTMIIEPVIIPETMDAKEILPFFRQKKQYFAIVVSEYGSFEGIVTLHDLMENIVGDIPQEGEPSEPDVLIRPDRSALINGDAPVEVLSHVMDNFIINFEKIDYSTVAGFVFNHINKVPQTGDMFMYGAYRIEIVDMDGNQIDKVLITKDGIDSFQEE
jgi:putative hemolysin